MIRICETCGYSIDPPHPKHQLHTVPTMYRQPMPQVSVKVADATGIHEIPLAVSGGAVAAGVSPSLAEGESSSPSEAADHLLAHAGDVLDAVIANEHIEMPRLSEADRIRLAPGACCAHPKELHIADAEGFPPTCMGCPEGLDEHEWKSHDAVIITTVAGITSTPTYSRTINSPLNLVCPDCSFLARTAAGLKTHRTRKHADG